METDLFVHFAEIAGVFVGFGALISLRSARRPTRMTWSTSKACSGWASGW